MALREFVTVGEASFSALRGERVNTLLTTDPASFLLLNHFVRILITLKPSKEYSDIQYTSLTLDKN